MLSKTITLRIDDQQTLDSIDYLKKNYNEKASSKAILRSINNAEKFNNQTSDLYDAYELLQSRYDSLVQSLRDINDAQQNINTILSD